MVSNDEVLRQVRSGLKGGEGGVFRSFHLSEFVAEPILVKQRAVGLCKRAVLHEDRHTRRRRRILASGEVTLRVRDRVDAGRPCVHVSNSVCRSNQVIDVHCFSFDHLFLLFYSGINRVDVGLLRFLRGFEDAKLCMVRFRYVLTRGAPPTQFDRSAPVSG